MDGGSFTKPAGFTLVELAVAIIIIGVMIGGVLKGQELIVSAQISRLIQDLQQFEEAHYFFAEKYSQVPGDMVTARTRLPDCTAPLCANGNGNGRIGRLDNDNIIRQIGYPPTDERSETALFWKHLALSGFITAVDPGADLQQPDWGYTHPATPFGGGYEIAYRQQGAGAEIGFGHYFRTANHLRFTTLLNLARPGVFLLSPIVARRIDEKMDDGKPNEGTLLAEYNTSGCDSSSNLNAVYADTHEKNCFILYFYTQ